MTPTEEVLEAARVYLRMSKGLVEAVRKGSNPMLRIGALGSELALKDLEAAFAKLDVDKVEL